MHSRRFSNLAKSAWKSRMINRAPGSTSVHLTPKPVMHTKEDCVNMFKAVSSLDEAIVKVKGMREMQAEHHKNTKSLIHSVLNSDNNQHSTARRKDRLAPLVMFGKEDAANHTRPSFDKLFSLVQKKDEKTKNQFRGNSPGASASQSQLHDILAQSKRKAIDRARNKKMQEEKLGEVFEFLDRPRKPKKKKTNIVKYQIKRIQYVSNISRVTGVPIKTLMKALTDLTGKEAKRNTPIPADMCEVMLAGIPGIWAMEFVSEDVVAKRNVTGEPRAPVVCVMGHVDHGKTTLMDALRNASVAAGEAGGITQAISAFQVPIADLGIPGDFATFLDTPGHAAFNSMRERGAHHNLTDLVIIVIDATKGCQPQTVHSIKLAKDARIPFIIALNKMDLPGADPDMVRQQLLEHDVVVEELGGDTLAVELSALKKDGLEDLKENISLITEMSDLRAHPKGPAQTFVVESELLPGKGVTLDLLVRDGSIKVGDHVVCGMQHGKVKRLTTSEGKMVKMLGPSQVGQMVGIDSMEQLGVDLMVVKNMKEARKVVADREMDKHLTALEVAVHEKNDLETIAAKSKKRQIAQHGLVTPMWWLRSHQNKAMPEGNYADDVFPTLLVMVKSDSLGSVEVLKEFVEGFPTHQVKLRMVRYSVGKLLSTDLDWAAEHHCEVFGFNLKLSTSQRNEAIGKGVHLYSDNVIYNVMDEIKARAALKMDAELKRTYLGEAKIIDQIQINGQGRSNHQYIMGCTIENGSFAHGGKVEIIRDGEPVYEDAITSIRVFKDEVKEVSNGECGIQCSPKDNQFQKGDVLRHFKEEWIVPKIEDYMEYTKED